MSDTRPTLDGDWDLDPAHTRIGFSARHAMVTTVRGSFNDVQGHVHADLDDLSKSSVTITLKSASVDTRSADRDTHLRSADFFDVENHPEIRFVSTSFTGDTLVGDLTIKGVTKPVTLDVDFNGVATDPWGNTKAAFEAEGEIDRTQWGLNWNAALETGGVLVSEKIKLKLDVQLALQA